MVKSSPSSPPGKRQKTATAKGTCTKNKNDAFAIMRQSARVCWPSRRHLPSSLPILEIVAANGWVPWQDQKEARQNPDHSKLRLVSRHIKDLMDRPSSGAPDFEAIVSFLNERNRFNSVKHVGFCDHCFSNEGEGCDACDSDYTGCRCTNDHRYGSVLMKLDPRLNPSVNFEALSSRRRAALLLQFVRKVTANFHESYHREWGEFQEQLKELVAKGGDIVEGAVCRMAAALGWDQDEIQEIEGRAQALVANGGDVGDLLSGMAKSMGLGKDNPDLTMIDPRMSYPSSDDFMAELQDLNEPVYKFMHHLLFTGWAAMDWFGQPGSVSPFRGAFLGDERYDIGWNGGHQDSFHEAMECFLRLHKSNETDPMPAGQGARDSGPRCTVEQFLYVPKTIQQCVKNTRDHQMVKLLGAPLADIIDLFRLVRETYKVRKKELGRVNWMPCLGMSEADFVPLRNFQGYNPETEDGRRNIRGTTLMWVDYTQYNVSGGKLQKKGT
ncbi:hypothetical protein ACHAXT_000220 [Thalassiosira profunda]